MRRSKMTNDSALFAFQKLDIYRVARELAAAASRIQHLGLRFKRMLWKLRAG